MPIPNAFDIQIPDHPIHALIDAYLFERAIRNLIENAIQYGSSGHYLGVSLEETEAEVFIRITDRGSVIPEEQLPFIFNRFYRGSAAREKITFLTCCIFIYPLIGFANLRKETSRHFSLVNLNMNIGIDFS